MKFFLFIEENRFSVEIVFIIDKVNLKLSIWNRCHFNNQGLFFITHCDVDT